MTQFKVVAFGNYSPLVSPRLRSKLSDALLRLQTASERNGSDMVVYVGSLDSARALVMRTCHSLQIECIEVTGNEIAKIVKDPKHAFMLVLRTVAGKLSRQGYIDTVDNLVEYVDEVLERLEPECESSDIVVEISDKDFGPGVFGPGLTLENTLADGKLPAQEFERTGSYSDTNSYIDSWFDGVRTETDTPYHDLTSTPPSGGVDHSIAAQPDRS